MNPPRDVIFAHASGAGRAAVAVVRLSGAGTAEVLAGLIAGPMPPPRRASLRRLHAPDGEVLDQALVLWLPGPASFTGEDQAELHLHGGVAVRAAILAVLARLPGCRPAEPGEFTRRAFLNGKLDLSAVEGLADLIDAETEAQRRQALRQLEGSLSARVFPWRDRLVDGLASIEATLDFAEEDDIPITLPDALREDVSRLRTEIEALVRRAPAGERIRDGFVVVLAGAPNSGKSTLLNAIARREVAIVSPLAGTTRDAIEVRCDLGGVPVTLVDTAGLREAGDEIEREGVARARARMGSADLVLWLTSPDTEGAGPPMEAPSCPVLRVFTKADLGAGGDAAGSPAVSALTGDGLPDLLEGVAAVLMRDGAIASAPDWALPTRERHRLAFEEVVSCLARADRAFHTGRWELAAEDLRLALRALGRVVGTVDVEQVLDRIFAQFCIGK